jgi:hypothetical protein
MSKTRSASSLNRLAISLTCAVLISTGAVAQTTGVKQSSSLEAEVTYDDQTLQSFAAAAASVLVLRRQYYPRIRAAEIGGSKDKADFLFKEMREQMHAAIRNSGFSSDQYRAISKAAKSDEILRGQINSILQGKPPALQRSQNVTRKAPPAPEAATAPANTAPAPVNAAPATPPPAPTEAKAALQPADNSAQRRLEAELTKANAERDRFRAEQTAMQKKTKELEHQLAAAKAQDSALREKLSAEKAQAQAEQKKNKKELEALAGELTNLKDELSTAKSRDSSLRDELAAVQARADAEQSSKDAKLAAFRQEIKGFVERLADARHELDSLALDLEPSQYGSGGTKSSSFEALKPLRKEPNSVERLLKKAGPQALTRLELEAEIAEFKKERLEQKAERAVIQREIAELSRALAATYQAMAELIGEPSNITVAAADLDIENETYTLDVSQETAQLFEIAPERLAQAPTDPQAEFLVDEPLPPDSPLGSGDPVNEPGSSTPAPSAALEPGLADFLRINSAPKVQIATVPAPAIPKDNAAWEFAGLPVSITDAETGAHGEVQTPSYDNNVLGGAMAYEAEDYRRAYEIWVKLAENGDSRAQFHLGALYFEGRGTGKDFAQSYFWLRVAAYQGHKRAPSLMATVAAELTSDQLNASDGQAREWLKQRSIEVTQFKRDSQNRL